MLPDMPPGRTKSTRRSCIISSPGESRESRLRAYGPRRVIAATQGFEGAVTGVFADLNLKFLFRNERHFGLESLVDRENDYSAHSGRNQQRLAKSHCT
jgi:hypothetical protein